MPLGDKEGDTNKSRLCGVDTLFSFNTKKLITSYIDVGGFDFVVTPLLHPGHRESQSKKDGIDSLELQLLPYGGSDLNVSGQQWSEYVVGEVSSWIDLDSKDELFRKDSEALLKQAIDWASYLSLQACLLPTPKGNSCVNYARIPFGMSDDDSQPKSNSTVDSWETWNSFRLHCDHHSQLSIVLDILRVLPPENSQKRWYGEPVAAAILDSDLFLTKSRARITTKYLSKRHQKLITDFFDYSIQIIISAKKLEEQDTSDFHSITDPQRHPLQPYLDHIGNLYKRKDPLSEKELFEFGIRDFLHSAIQPLKDYSLALSYESLEKDAVKYSEYERAICLALLERIPSEETAAVATT
ncbi:PRMT5, TIM barrel domain, partial [Sesbania bispinosa]